MESTVAENIDLKPSVDEGKNDKVIDKKYLLPFALISSLFALWGFANDITNPMVSAFQTVMEISTFKASLVQFAFYSGYFTMALPAAILIKKYSYKSVILVGLGLYATGCLLFIPAAQYQIFGFFLISLYIITFGLAFLETTANPLILSLGSPATATRRLNFAQSFNPIGSITGMFVAQQFILSNLDSAEKAADGSLIYTTLSAVEKEGIRLHDLMVIRDPYALLGVVVIAMFIVIALTKIPQEKQPGKEFSVMDTIKKLAKNIDYREGVIAQIFYVGAQIMCWTFIIQYAENIGYTKAEAQSLNIIAMFIFLGCRFVATFLMKYINSALLLALFAIGGVSTISITIFVGGDTGLYALVATSAFMSLMFPTIYGIALDKVGEDSEFGAAGLVMAIVGGALMPPLQGKMIDQDVIFGIDGVNFSFILPLICFVIIAIFGFRRYDKG
ncbi:L-fucose:H+ symporter permease [Flammeovirga sp. EKP202]|uniref:L-fucose:H+ symporter permease n=1 Tax=Flammeovirga sp. EKP202 TaxID=2770592 RepID=UPI00165FA907|nr:L-fucose:H+ symporter permease [Flammeovirga sp. EKP202]MBD0403485.1 L-fucose:H+ symporter permease [Flammeovirga sp. EKP202]